MPVRVQELPPDHSDSYYLSVLANSVAVKAVVIPDGEMWRLTQFVGDAPHISDASVHVVWDHGGAGEVMLACTHGDARIPLDILLVGDGIKKLALVLDNATPGAHTMGAIWEALNG